MVSAEGTPSREPGFQASKNRFPPEKVLCPPAEMVQADGLNPEMQNLGVCVGRVWRDLGVAPTYPVFFQPHLRTTFPSHTCNSLEAVRPGSSQ